MLKTIRDFDWSAVEHAYGPATDVPDCLENLASGDPERVEGAQWALMGNIFHQGTVYSATQHAVPFLFELLAEDSKTDRKWLLHYLGYLASGTSYLDVHFDHYSEEERTSPEFQASMKAELSDVNGAFEAVRKGLPTIIEFMSHKVPQLRAEACHLLQLFVRSDGDKFWDRLIDRFQNDTDEIVRVSALVTTSTFVTDEPKVLQVLELASKLFPEETEFVQWGIAMVVANLERKIESKEMMDALLTGVQSPSVIKTFSDCPWSAGGPAVQQTCRAFSNLDVETVTEFTPVILDAMDGASEMSAFEIAGIALDIAFDFKPCAVSFAEMTDAQKTIVGRIATCDHAWEFANMAEILRYFQIPDKQSGLQAFCGLPITAVERTEIKILGADGAVTTASFKPAEK